jgi:DNA-binding CsgD family transcriptional regulator
LQTSELFIQVRLLSVASVVAQKKKSELEIRNLSECELEVQKLIVQEMSSEVFAEKLFISKRTVDSHRKHLLINQLKVNSVNCSKLQPCEKVIFIYHVVFISDFHLKNYEKAYEIAIVY